MMKMSRQRSVGVPVAEYVHRNDQDGYQNDGRGNCPKR